MNCESSLKCVENLRTVKLLCRWTLLSRISGLLSYSSTIQTIFKHLKPVLQEHRKVMSKKINTPAPAMLNFSAITKTTEPILETERWKSVYQLLHINFLSLALIGQEASPHFGMYLSLIMQIVPLVSIIQNITESQNGRGWKGPLWVI